MSAGGAAMIPACDICGLDLFIALVELVILESLRPLRFSLWTQWQISSSSGKSELHMRG